MVTPVSKTGCAADLWQEVNPDPADLYRAFDELYHLEKNSGGIVAVSGNLICAMEKSLKESRPVVRCPVGMRPGVDPAGAVYPCSLLMEKPFLLGNLADEGQTDVILKARLGAVAASALSRMDRVKECQGCFWKGYCSSGCMARAYHQGGSLNLPDPDCAPD